MPAKPFTFYYGDDDYLVAERGKAWFAAQAGSAADEFSREVIDGRAANASEVAEVVARFRSAVETLSLFGERKVVWLRGISFMADTPTGRAEGTQQLLEGLKPVLEGLDPGALPVLLTACPVDKRRAFFKWCSKTGAAEAVGSGGDAFAAGRRIAADTADAYGAVFAPGALDLLVAKVGGNSRMVAGEVAKLATWAGADGAQIDEAAVAGLVPNFGEGNFFEATETFFTLDLAATLDAIERHFFTATEARPLLASLQNRNRLLMQLRALADAGLVEAGSRGIAKDRLAAAGGRFGRHFGDPPGKSSLNVFTQNPWYLGRLAGAAAGLRLRRLIEFQIAFAASFEALVARSGEHKEVMRELAVQCLG